MAVKARAEISLVGVSDGAKGATGADGKMLYGTCSTAAATAAKVATVTGFKLVYGTSVSIRFTDGNTAASPTLNINSLGAKAIYTNGTRYAYWTAGATVTFVYDGTNFQVASVPVYANTATVGNPAKGNVYIDSDGVNIREGSTVNATFSTDLIELGKNSTNSQISMCGGVGTIRALGNSSAAPGFDKALAIQSGVLGIDGQSITIATSSQYETDEDNAHKSFCDISTYAYKEEDDSHWAAFSLRTEDWNSGNFANISAEANEITHSEGNAVQASSGALQFSVGGENSSSIITMDTTDSSLVRFESTIKDLPLGVGVGGSGNYIYNGLYDLAGERWLLANNGTDIYIGSSRGTAYIPYYKPGDSISFLINTAGFITNASKSLRFMLPISKPLYCVKSVSASSVDGFQVRQNGKYLYGSGASAYAKPSSYAVSVQGGETRDGLILGGTLRIEANFSSTTNVTNNSAAGAQWSGKITFS